MTQATGLPLGSTASGRFRSSTSALPESGALQLNTEGARNDQPVASAIGA
jgi:hypothetical protein